MKKYLFILSAFLLSLASCSEKKESGGMSEKAQKNLETHRAVAKTFETNDFSKLDEYIAADAVDYAGEMGPTRGIDSIKAAFKQMSEMLVENTHQTFKELADDEYVMAWMKFKAKCAMDIPSMNMKKGQVIETEAIEVSQFKDGKVIAHWTFMQPGDVMKMMSGGAPTGDMTAPPADDKKDTTSK